MKKIKFIAGLTAIAVSFSVTQLSCAFSPGEIIPVTANADYSEYGVIYNGLTDEGLAYDVFGSYDYIYDDAVGDLVTKNIKCDYVSITGYKGDDPVVTVPNTIDGCKVTKISKISCDNLVSVVIPSSVKTIGDGAFYGCSNLSEINLPDSIVSIGDNAFCECGSLTEVVLPKNLTSLNGCVFELCDSLSEVELPPDLKTIGGAAFKECSNLSKITIPETVKTINDRAFCGCKSLYEIILPSSLKVIPSFCFEGCSALKKVIIPDSITTIGDNAFIACQNLKNVVIPSSVISIGDKAFGYYESWWNYYTYDDFTISGYKGTAAETYANENGIEFIDLEQQATENNYNAGDANCDNGVDLSDAVMIMQALANPNKYGLNGTDEHHITAQGIKNADVIGSNGMTTEDAGTIQRYLLHIIDEIPVKK